MIKYILCKLQTCYNTKKVGTHPFSGSPPESIIDNVTTFSMIKAIYTEKLNSVKRDRDESLDEARMDL